MKYVKLIIFSALIFNCNAQENKLLVSKTLVSDLSESPFYSRITRIQDSQTVWKKQYKYIDSINIYRISYLSDGLKINGYLVQPKKKEKYPCIIYNRGGSMAFGTLTDLSAAVFLGKLAKEGYTVVASQYRGNGGSEGQEEFGGNDINDVTILPKVLEEIKGTDTQNIGMYGWSRGGMMTYIALTKSNQIKAAVVGGAISDARKIIEDRPEMETEVLAKLIPDYSNNKEEELRKRSAIEWVDQFKKNVPILILHGNSDWRVKSEQSLRIALEFEKHRIPYRLIMFEDGDHGISQHEKEVMSQTISWFDKFLK